MTDHCTGWTHKCADGHTHFLLSGECKFSWESQPHLSAEHVSLIGYAYMQGVQDGGAVTLDTLKQWCSRLEGAAQDIYGVADEMSGDDA